MAKRKTASTGSLREKCLATPQKRKLSWIDKISPSQAEEFTATILEWSDKSSEIREHFPSLYPLCAAIGEEFGVSEQTIATAAKKILSEQ